MAHPALATISRDLGQPYVENIGGPIGAGLAPGTVSLYFPVEAMAMRTRFRDTALNFIYQVALDLSDGHMQSAAVEIWSNPDEVDSMILNLTLEVDASRDAIRELRYKTLVRVTEWLKDRTEDEKADYGRRVYFGVVPSRP